MSSRDGPRMQLGLYGWFFKGVVLCSYMLFIGLTTTVDRTSGECLLSGLNLLKSTCLPIIAPYESLTLDELLALNYSQFNQVCDTALLAVNCTVNLGCNILDPTIQADIEQLTGQTLPLSLTTAAELCFNRTTAAPVMTSQTTTTSPKTTTSPTTTTSHRTTTSSSTTTSRSTMTSSKANTALTTTTWSLTSTSRVTMTATTTQLQTTMTPSNATTSPPTTTSHKTTTYQTITTSPTTAPLIMTTTTTSFTSASLPATTTPYTTRNAPTAVTSSLPMITFVATATTPSTTSGSSMIAIVVGSVVGAAAFIAITAVVDCLCRRRGPTTAPFKDASESMPVGSAPTFYSSPLPRAVRHEPFRGEGLPPGWRASFSPPPRWGLTNPDPTSHITMVRPSNLGQYHVPPQHHEDNIHNNAE